MAQDDFELDRPALQCMELEREEECMHTGLFFCRNEYDEGCDDE